MLGKTHVSAGMAASLLVLQPVSIAPLACALLGGALGGWISDIDVRGVKLVRGTIVSACVAALAFASRFLAEVLPRVAALQAIAPRDGACFCRGRSSFCRRYVVRLPHGPPYIHALNCGLRAVVCGGLLALAADCACIWHRFVQPSHP